MGEEGDEVSVPRFIADQRTKHQVPHSFSCRLLGVSESWFYKWIKNPVTVDRPGRPSSTPRSSGRSTRPARIMAALVCMGTWSIRCLLATGAAADAPAAGVGEHGRGLDAPPRPGRAGR